MLEARAQHLLKTLIERYVSDGQPVGSRALSRHSGLELSPATVRNVMADLEEMGFIASPHTSAGRMPTAKGYRFFVDSLMVTKPLERDRDRSPRRRARRRPAAAARQRRGGTAVAAHAVRGCRHDAQAPRRDVPPSRVPAPRRAARAADPRDRRRRRAEPHPAHRPLVLARPARGGDQFLQPAFRRPDVRHDPHAHRATSCARCTTTSRASCRPRSMPAKGRCPESESLVVTGERNLLQQRGLRLEHGTAAHAVRPVRPEDVDPASSRSVAKRGGRAASTSAASRASSRSTSAAW